MTWVSVPQFVIKYGVNTNKETLEQTVKDDTSQVKVQ